LVKDINPIDDANVGSEPRRVTAAGDHVFFFALDNAGLSGLWRSDGTPNDAQLIAQTSETELAYVNGVVYFGSCQLWRTDGTPAGTVLLKDLSGLATGQSCAGFSRFTAVGGSLYFVVDDWQGRSLWKSNGTTSGTRLVKRVFADFLFAVGQRLFFTQRDEATGYELWTSDGTTGGTHLVKDICPGPCDGISVESFASVKGTLFFPAQDGVNGEELWRSDGTRVGTRMVKDIAPGVGATSSPRELTRVGNRLFFTTYWPGGDALWKSDGTDAGTVVVSYVAASGLKNANGRLFFVGRDSVSGLEPWTSDGTLAGTLQLGDLCSGSCSSSFGDVFIAVGGRVFFTAWRGVATAPELWKSDGTPNGTVLVKNVPGLAAAGAVVNGVLFFPANDGTTGPELWRTDGTDVGTVSVTDRVSNSSCTYAGAGVIDRLFFAVCNPRDSAGLWVSDGRSGGTNLVKNFPYGPYMATSYLGGALFSARDGSGLAVWRSDGTETGTVKVSDVEPQFSPPFRFVIVGGEAFFAGRDGVGGVELWKTNGTPAGTTIVKDIVPGLAGSFPQYLTVVNDVLFFAAYSWDEVSGTAWGLWRSDGTDVGTTLVKKVVARDLTDVNGTLFFAGYERDLVPQTGVQLWKSDGIEAGTVPVREEGLYPRALLSVNDTLFFVASESVNGTELWKSDGTASGTVVVKDIVPGSLGSDLFLLTAANRTLFFVACTESTGCEPWKTDGTASGTVMVRDINPGVYSSINPGWYFAAVPAFVPVEGRVFFQADDGTTGLELWESDGTDTGTHLVQDLAAGRQSSFPHDIARVGTKLFFSANDGLIGDELWALHLGPEVLASSTTVVEDVCRKTVAEVVVRLSSASARPVTVEYATSDGTANSVDDYVRVAGALEFPPGVTSRVIRVPVRNDRVLEADEYFNVTLTGVEGGVLDETASTAAVWIQDRPQPVICR
jgi:ELWxxDGT repeat protein